MDPTRQCRQTPLKAALDRLVRFASTHLVPAISTLSVLFLSEWAPIGPLVAIPSATVYFWAITYEATTAYRHYLALPRTITISLDPPSSFYMRVLLTRCLIGFLPPICLLLAPSRVPPALSVLLAGSVIWVYAGLRELIRLQLEGYPHLLPGRRGIHVMPARLLRNVMRWTRRRRASIPWGGIDLHINELLTNCCIFGAVGSGKTLTLKAVLTKLLPLVLEFRNWRAMLVDPKWELDISALVPRYKICRIHLGDPDTYVWDAAQDLQHEKDFHQTAHIIIPPQEETQPFFTDGARAILQADMMALARQAPDDWWFSDAFFAARSPKRLETILKLHPETRGVHHAYSQNQRVWYDVYATLRSKIADFDAVANVWAHVQRAHPNRTVSLTEWVVGNFVLHVGMQASASASQGRIISLLLQRAGQMLLDEPTGQSTLDYQTGRRTLIAIDELPRAGKLEILDLLTNGRDYGVGICCATQSIDALLEHYPKDRWNALANEIHSVAYLSANSPTTLKWMSDWLGNCDSRLPPSDRPRPLGTSGDWTATLDPTQFHMLRHGKKVGPNCIPGIFANSQIGAWYSDDGVDLPPQTSVPARRPIPDHWQDPRPWDDEDLERLNLTHLRDELDLDSDDGSPSQPASPPSRPRPPKTTRTSYPRFRP